MSCKYTDQQFVDAVKKSYNIRQVCLKLGISAYGDNYAIVKRKIINMGLDISHFGTKKTKRITCKSLPLDVILTQGSYYTNTSTLKKLLLNNHIFEYKCYQCGKKTILRNGKKTLIPLQLHHIDGDRNNNEISNLTLLCPICHSFTLNFRRKKVKKQIIKCQHCGKIIRKNKYGLCKDCYVQKYYPTIKNKCTSKKYFCLDCGKEITKTKSGLCRKCFYKKQTNPNKPSKQILQQQIKQHSMLFLGRKYGVSDNTIRKWCKQYGIDFKDYRFRKQSLQGLKKGHQKRSQLSKLLHTCPICGNHKEVSSEICRTCYLDKQIRKKQQQLKQKQQYYTQDLGI